MQRRAISRNVQFADYQEHFADDGSKFLAEFDSDEPNMYRAHLGRTPVRSVAVTVRLRIETE